MKRSYTTQKGSCTSLLSYPYVFKFVLALCLAIVASNLHAAVLSPPPAPVPDICSTLAADEIGGFVFEDWNFDGGLDATNSRGVAGVTVEAYDCNGNLVDTQTTAGDGTFTFSGLTPNTDYRIEFNLPAEIAVWAQSSKAGADNGSTVQFVQPGNCAPLGIAAPEEYTDANPTVIIPRWSAGDPLTGAAADDFSLVSTTFNTPNSSSDLLRNDEIGSTWGIAYDQEADVVYASAVLRRHVGLGPDGLGAIYAYENVLNNPGSAALTTSIVIPNVGTIPSNTLRGLSTTDEASHDVDAFDKVGKAGIGDIDIDPINRVLYAVNLNDKKVYAVDLTAATPTPTAIADYVAPTCTSGEFRPWALKYYRGKLYLGGVCSAEAQSGSQNQSNLSATVLSYDIATSSWTGSVLSFPLNYPKESAQGSRPPGFYPWLNVVGDMPGVNHNGSGEQFSSFPTPILADVEFADDGHMIVGFMDRTAMQFGARNYGTNTANTSTLYYIVSGGDILKATPNAAGDMYTIESLAAATDEFYDGDSFAHATDPHREVCFGGITVPKGREQVLFGGLDPDGFDTGGLFWLSTEDGSQEDNLRLYNGGNTASPATFGKSAGLGDVEVLSGPAPIEIGNYVWRDANNDGVQDACEMGIDGVTVELVKDGNVIASTQTANGGQYYFSNAASIGGGTWTGTGMNTSVLPNMTYTVRIANAEGASQQAALSGLELTTTDANTNMANRIDSDASMNADATTAEITFTTARAGSVDHTLDFGFSTSTAPPCPMPNCRTATVTKNTP